MFAVCVPLRSIGARHFHFVRNTGLFHHLIEDLPHGLVGIARLAIHRDCGGGGGAAGVSGLMEGDLVTIVSTVVSVLSMVFSFVNKSIQLLILRASSSSSSSRLRNSALLTSVNNLRQSLGGAEAACVHLAPLDERLLVQSDQPEYGGAE